jgi:oxalate---CoA ligase
MMNYPADNVPLLLARSPDDGAAIGAPGRKWLSHAALRALAQHTVATLNAMKLGRGDPIALVVPNGPEAASAFAAVACGAPTAPLNPGYKKDEFSFYLGDIGARALIVPAGMDTPARQAAEERGIAVIDLVPELDGPAGAFRLLPGIDGHLASRDLAMPGMARAEDVALILHTSGTTSRPKIVPLQHINVTASAYNVADTLRLKPDDVCMNIMPLFHIHGLIAATLASLAAGGAVCCTSGFNAFRFYSYLEEVRPTWYTAVPTMHQTLLELAPRHKAAIAASRLRFIRSSSSSLLPQVMTAMESTFGVPVIEAYGMTEAAHQMTSNPLPPQPRYPGCVGIAAGPEVAIMNEDGCLMVPGEVGEVVIRGRNVTEGYANNPDANAAAFINGWFRTGDQGFLDADGYLRLTGRIKELINRGGEKFSPLEVDEVLMDHPYVAQCLTFGVPHTKLGEEVGAAIVLRADRTIKDVELRAFCAERLAHFKVPKRIVFVTEIPKGPTGKLQRIGLAQKLGLTQ